MKNLAIVVVTSLALTGTALAAEQRGTSANTPGHEMQDKGSKTGSPGASGYAPGHEMKSDSTGSTKGSTSGSMDKDMKGETSGARR